MILLLYVPLFLLSCLGVYAAIRDTVESFECILAFAQDTSYSTPEKVVHVTVAVLVTLMAVGFLGFCAIMEFVLSYKMSEIVLHAIYR
jgi:hypothetical protein